MNITVQRINGASPIILRQSHIDRLITKGLPIMDRFLNIKKETELHMLILQGIDNFGNLISTRNLHERIVMLVSFFELFLNPETSSRSKAETYLKNNVVPMMIHKADVETFKQKIRNMYVTRDKFLHNRVLLSIYLEDLLHIQAFGLEFLKETIVLSNSLSTKREFYNHFGIPS